MNETIDLARLYGVLHEWMKPREFKFFLVFYEAGVGFNRSILMSKSLSDALEWREAVQRLASSFLGLGSGRKSA